MVKAATRNCHVDARFFCRVYGFARIVKRSEITSLQELVSKDLTEQFVSWCINDRKQKGRSVLTYLGMLNSVVRLIRHSRDRVINGFQN